MNSPAAFLTCLAAPGFYAINTPETEAVCGIMAQMPPVQTGQGREMLKRIIEIVGFAAPLTAIPLHGMASTAVWANSKPTQNGAICEGARIAYELDSNTE
jgi:hypothetical protein